MPLLTANGYDIPCWTQGQAERRIEEVGERGAAWSGTPRLSRRALQRHLPLETTPLAAADAEAVRQWLLGRGDLWNWDDGTGYTAKGLGTTGTPVYSFRPGLGKFGGYAVSVDPAATNVIPSNAQTFSTSWTASGGAVVTLTQGVALTSGSYTVTANGATRIQTSGGTVTLKYSYTSSLTSGNPGGISLWVKNQGLASVTIRSVGSATGQVVVAAGSTTHVRAYHASLSTSAVIQFLAASVSDALDLVVFQPQIEAQAPTAFTSSIRSGAGLLPYPLTVATDAWTFAAWVYLSPAPADRVIIGHSPDFWLYVPSSGNNRVLAGYTPTGGVATYVDTGAVGGVDVSTAWTHVAVTFHRGATRIRVYINGTQRAESTSVSLAETYTGSFGMGTLSGSSTSSPVWGLMDEVVYAPYEMNAGQVAALAARTLALPALPYVECTGDVLRNVRQSRLGEINDVSLVPVGNGSTFYETSQFTLYEL